MTLSVESITLPSQTTQQLEKPLKITLGVNPYETGRSLIGRQVAIGVVSRAATMPLYFVSGMGSMAIYGIGSGMGALVGTGQELTRNNTYDKRTTSKKMAVGAFRGATGIPTVVSLARKNENLSYQANELVMAYLEKSLWEKLLN